MIARQRLTFQLTPLLDLLLIVIFAQYMEMQSVTERQEHEQGREATQLRADRDATSQALAELRRDLDALRDKTADADTRLADSERERMRLKEELRTLETESKERLERISRERNLIAEMLVQVLKVPKEDVAEVLDPERRSDGPRSDAQIAELRRRFQELAESNAADVVRHVLTYEELRKRCDIWEIHVTEQGLIKFHAGKHRFEFRAETAEDFQRQLFAFYKSLPQPKGLVIILFSYGDAKAVWREAVLAGLPRATERMRADTNGRSRFEYAVIGYQPAGPMSSREGE